MVAVVSGQAQSNVVTNGGFESYAKPTNSWTIPGLGDYGIPPGDTNLTGWTITNGPIAYVRAWPAPNGISSIDLSGNGNAISGGIAQSVPTQAGRTYLFSFHMSGNPGTSFPRDPSEKRMSVRLGSFQQVYSYDTAVEQNTFADMKWRQHQLVYLANTNLTRIAFLNIMTTNLTGPVIDKIVLTECVPPLLSIRSVGTNRVLSWPDTACPVVLASSSGLEPGSRWQTNTLPVVRSGGRSFVTNSISTNRFFQLQLQ